MMYVSRRRVARPRTHLLGRMKLPRAMAPRRSPRITLKKCVGTATLGGLPIMLYLTTHEPSASRLGMYSGPENTVTSS